MVKQKVNISGTLKKLSKVERNIDDEGLKAIGEILKFGFNVAVARVPTMTNQTLNSIDTRIQRGEMPSGSLFIKETKRMESNLSTTDVARMIASPRTVINGRRIPNIVSGSRNFMQLARNEMISAGADIMKSTATRIVAN